MSPQRIQRERTAGWRMPEGAVYVGRPTKWGNPYALGRVGTAHGWTGWYVGDIRSDWDNLGEYPTKVEAAGRAVQLYQAQAWLINADVCRELAGKDLVCWCPLEDTHGNRVPCHADVLLEIANSGATP
jgi:Domain of unknown function (DUF4326)